MKIETRKSLRALNSFRFPVHAARFCAPQSLASLTEILAARGRDEPLLVIGGGSNVILTRDWPGLVIKPDLAGIRVLETGASSVRIQVGAGEDWPSLVQYTLEQGWYGLENLSLIPGTAGAAPIQNIGAYGVELCEFLTAVEAVEIETGATVRLSREQCRFGYRDSLFKGAGRDRYLITAIELQLSLTAAIRTGYGEIAGELTRMGIEDPSPRDVSHAVIAIRRRKLPDPRQLPNAGSFFKNPEVDAATRNALLERFPDLVSFPLADSRYKVAAGWMIDQCGWKGRRLGDAGVHAAQALVLVNHGAASAQEVLQLAARIQADVQDRFGLQLEIEPRIY